jgi:hypothetical protein
MGKTIGYKLLGLKGREAMTELWISQIKFVEECRRQDEVSQSSNISAKRKQFAEIPETVEGLCCVLS